jgi:O-antigen ligase
MFLEVLMSTGILGFIPFVLMVVLAFIKGIKILKSHPKHGWIFILFSMALVQHMLSYTFYSAIYFWSGMGLVYSFSLSKMKTLKQVQNE